MKTTKNTMRNGHLFQIIQILIIGGSGSARPNALLNLVKEQDDIDKMYLHAKDLSEPRYEFLIKKHWNKPL